MIGANRPENRQLHCSVLTAFIWACLETGNNACLPPLVLGLLRSLVRDSAAPQQAPYGSRNLSETSLLYATAGDEDHIPSTRQWASPHRLPKPALDPVSGYGIAYALADHKSEPAVVQSVFQITNHQQPVGGAGALAVDL